MTIPPRLSAATVSAAAAVQPTYDRTTVSAGVVHLGLGAFARAHVAVYLDDLLAAGHHGLGVVGVSLRNDDVPHALGPQDGLYTLGLVRDAALAPRIIGSVLAVLHAPSDPQAVRAALASAALVAVTLTVTEKGYCCDPATHRLDVEHPDVRHDIDAPESPRSLPGHLVLAARDRRARGLPGVTVVSLDNVPANGRTLRSVVTDLAAATDPTLSGWIDAQFAFPCSMVDRIVPATTAEVRAQVASTIGLDDAWPVRAEPYTQWVLDREWTGTRPPFEEVGVMIVDDVAPWEAMKLRVVNGLHTAAAHFGLFHGLDTVDRVVTDPAGRRLLDRVADEVAAVLVPPPGVQVDEYVAATMARFENAALAHRCAQIATDTSQKLPQRLLDTVRDRLRLGLPVDALADVLALWAWSTLGLDGDGGPRPVQDPLAALYAEIAVRHAADAAALTGALCSLETIFGDLAGNAVLQAAVAERLAPLLRDR